VGKYFGFPQDWSSYQSLSFWFFGTNSGALLRFEILENRASGSGSDTSERFEYLFADNFYGWKLISLPWSQFVRRFDWQPDGAPNDGFTRTEIWGFNLSPITGQGSFQVDEILLHIL
jgi:hypothetical protein